MSHHHRETRPPFDPDECGRIIADILKKNEIGYSERGRMKLKNALYQLVVDLGYLLNADTTELKVYADSLYDGEITA